LDIEQEFYDHVVKVAKSTSYKWEDLDWEDIRQDMWVYLLERPAEYDRMVEDGWDDRDKKLRKVGSQVAVATLGAYELYSGQYVYGKDEVKGLLRSGALIKSEFGTLSERLDLSLAMEELKDTNPSYFTVLVDNYVHEKSMTDAQYVVISRALDKLTLLMNQIHNFNEYTYEGGPGARQVFSNSTSVAITGSWG
jgi:hypothetical protein